MDQTILYAPRKRQVSSLKFHPFYSKYEFKDENLLNNNKYKNYSSLMNSKSEIQSETVSKSKTFKKNAKSVMLTSLSSPISIQSINYKRAQSMKNLHKFINSDLENHLDYTNEVKINSNQRKYIFDGKSNCLKYVSRDENKFYDNSNKSFPYSERIYDFKLNQPVFDRSWNIKFYH